MVSDLQASLECGVDSVAISISSSDIHIEQKLRKTREWVLESVRTAVDFAKKYNLYVSVNAEDASRTDMEFLLQFARNAREAGADRLRYCDTLGIMDPFETFLRIKTIKDIVGVDIEMHMHNDFGMAIANSIAGIKAGAKYVNTTINGLGERAGNAAFEELVMALKFLEGIDLGFNTRNLREISDYVATASDRIIPAWKPVVGSNIFVFESENRIKLYEADHRNYELFDPEDVGLENKIIIGKYSGMFSLNKKLELMGYKFNEEELAELLEIFISKAVSLKRSLFDNEIIETCDLYKKKNQSFS